MSCKHGNHEDGCDLCDAEDSIWAVVAAKNVEIADLKAAYESLFKENAANRAALATTKATAPVAASFESAEARAEVIEAVAAKYGSRAGFGEAIFPAQNWMMFVADLATELAPLPVEAIGEPVAWTLTEELEKRETTCRAHLWFANPKNSSWTPLYTRPAAVEAATPATSSGQDAADATKGGV